MRRWIDRLDCCSRTFASSWPKSQAETSSWSRADSNEVSLTVSLGHGRWAELIDVPLWALSAVFVFRIAFSFRGGAVGRGASWVGWALTLVAAGKALRAGFILLQWDRLFAAETGQLAWGLILALAWALAGLGIYEFYRAGRSI